MTQASDAMLARVALVRAIVPSRDAPTSRPQWTTEPWRPCGRGLFCGISKAPPRALVMVGAILGLLKLKGVW